jgi:hypothetical protein
LLPGLGLARVVAAHDVGLSKKQRLKNRCSWWLRRLVLEGWLVMTKLSRAVIACISATMMLAGAASIAGADTFTYELNDSYAESNGGPSLVPYGSTLGPDSTTGLRIGYTFGVQQGLSLSGTGIFDAYSIDIRFYFDDVNASINTFQKILDFKNRTSDSGLYSASGSCCYLLPLGPATHQREVVYMILEMARLPTF